MNKPLLSLGLADPPPVVAMVSTLLPLAMAKRTHVGHPGHTMPVEVRGSSEALD